MIYVYSLFISVSPSIIPLMPQIVWERNAEEMLVCARIACLWDLITLGLSRPMGLFLDHDFHLCFYVQPERAVWMHMRRNLELLHTHLNDWLEVVVHGEQWMLSTLQATEEDESGQSAHGTLMFYIAVPNFHFLGNYRGIWEKSLRSLINDDNGDNGFYTCICVYRHTHTHIWCWQFSRNGAEFFICSISMIVV